jgi:hypothetical protein
MKTRTTLAKPRKIAPWLLTGAAFAVVLVLVAPGSSAATTNSAALQGGESHLLQRAETMPAFLNGRLVATEYEQGYFVGSPNGTLPSYGQEPLTRMPTVGLEPTQYPAARSTIEPFIALVPWFGPASAPYAPAYNPVPYHIGLQCAPATVQVCYDHPASIVVPGLGTVPLPGHDHLINTAASNRDIWWQLEVVLVTGRDAWPTLSGSTGITSFAALEAAQDAGEASKTLPTNTFLNFAVLPSGQSESGLEDGPAESGALQMQEAMPAFLNGHTVSTYYEQSYWTGRNVTSEGYYGMEPIFGAPEVGKPATLLPTYNGEIEPFVVLVPWFGPTAAPYDPAYHPAKYGIQLMCAPATVSVCFDHPATIFVPGLGTVPLPGHDHLINTAANHANIWWSLIVVLVTEKSYWPNLAGTHGITSFAALEAAQDAGAASSDLPTDVFFQFSVGTD